MLRKQALLNPSGDLDFLLKEEGDFRLVPEPLGFNRGGGVGRGKTQQVYVPVVKTAGLVQHLEGPDDLPIRSGHGQCQKERVT